MKKDFKQFTVGTFCDNHLFIVVDRDGGKIK